MKPTFKVRVGVVLFDDENRLLLARQNGRPFWVLPGGTLEQDDTLAGCAARELKEEANLDIGVGPLLFVADFFTPDGQHVIDMAFLGEWRGGEIVMETTENLNDIGFFTRDAVQAMNVRPELAFAGIMTAWQTGQWPANAYLGNYGD